jgi:hypothetical protein
MVFIVRLPSSGLMSWPPGLMTHPEAGSAVKLTVPEGRLATSPDEARSAAAALGYPVALKAVGRGIAHKTEIGAVRLGLGDDGAVAAAAAALQGVGDALLVERMITDGVVEIILGITHDPVVGPCLLIGSGGLLAELVGDSRSLILPAGKEEINDAIASLRAARLLGGYRGRPKGDVAALVAAARALQSSGFDVVHAPEGRKLGPVVLYRTLLEFRESFFDGGAVIDFGIIVTHRDAAALDEQAVSDGR